jgi:hypothetical protein
MSQWGAMTRRVPCKPAPIAFPPAINAPAADFEDSQGSHCTKEDIKDNMNVGALFFLTEKQSQVSPDN